MRAYEDWLHHKLLNWARWCWLGAWPHPLPPSHCTSLEHNYVRTHDENTSDGSRPPLPNDEDARRVDVVWRALPDIPKRVLRAEYPQRHVWSGSPSGHRAAARFAGLQYRDYHSGLIIAVDRVRQAFDAVR